MRKSYLQPEAESVSIFYESNVFQSGDGAGTGKGSDMLDPDETQNPF